MKKQVLMSIMAIGVVSMLMGTSTYACFYNGNNVNIRHNRSSNLIDIKDQDEYWGHGVTETWTIDDMKPGEEYPFHCRYVGLKKHRNSPTARYIKIKCNYVVIEENPQTESDTDPNTNLNPDSMAKQIIIKKCKYIGRQPFKYINCLTNRNPFWRIQDIDKDGKITFYDFRKDPLRYLPAPKNPSSREWFILGVKFDENAGNEFQGDTFDLTFKFIATK